MDKNEYLGCYVCMKPVFKESTDGQGMKTSLGFEVLPNENFSSVGVCIQNEKGDRVDYSTPVCHECNAVVVNESNTLQRESLKEKIIRECLKHDFGPRYLTSSKVHKLVSITDITQELKENGVVCQ